MKKFALVWITIHFACASGCFYGFLAENLGAPFALLYIIVTTIYWAFVDELFKIRKKNNSYNEKEDE